MTIITNFLRVIRVCLCLCVYGNMAKSQTRLFADDCLMYRKVNSISDCKLLHQDLDNLIKWEQQWQMNFNPDKCEVLTITKKHKPLHHDYSIHGHTLQNVDSAKYLGLNISKNLSWKTHVDSHQESKQHPSFPEEEHRHLPSNSKRTGSYHLWPPNTWVRCCSLGPLHSEKHQLPGASSEKRGKVCHQRLSTN